MKKKILKAISKLAEKSIKKSNSTACYGWTYQPKEPNGIKNFGK